VLAPVDLHPLQYGGNNLGSAYCKIIAWFKMIEHRRSSGKPINKTHIMHVVRFFLTFSDVIVVESSNTASACCCHLIIIYFFVIAGWLSGSYQLMWTCFYSSRTTYYIRIFSTYWFLITVDFCGGRRTGEPAAKPSKQRREPTTNSTHELGNRTRTTAV
jgi:hypothetical protein